MGPSAQLWGHPCNDTECEMRSRNYPGCPGARSAIAVLLRLASLRSWQFESDERSSLRHPGHAHASIEAFTLS
jgi:hypothetical protein